MSKTVEILFRAKNILRDGTRWTKGSYKDTVGNVCLIGAINEAEEVVGYDPEGVSYRDEAYEALCAAITGGDGSYLAPETFNDRPETTHGDVIRVLDRAICEQREVECA